MGVHAVHSFYEMSGLLDEKSKSLLFPGTGRAVVTND